MGVICSFATVLYGYLYVKFSFLFDPKDVELAHGHFIDIELPHAFTHVYTAENFTYAIPIIAVTITIMLVGNYAYKQAFNNGGVE